MLAPRAFCSSVLALMLPSCGPAEPVAQPLSVVQAPSREAFTRVGNALQLRCATLDCHGQVGRNLRLYGYGGLRLSVPESPIGDPTADPTTSKELDASYESLVGLEPEELSNVLAGRADPNLLSVVRKTRGIEMHKGGQLTRQGDALDRCLVLWLTGSSDTAPCEEVINAPRPAIE